MKLCLPLAICGPFCSLLPTKTIAVDLPAAMASRTSGQVRSSTKTERACALAGAADAASRGAASRATSNSAFLTKRLREMESRLSICQASDMARAAHEKSPRLATRAFPEFWPISGWWSAAAAAVPRSACRAQDLKLGQSTGPQQRRADLPQAAQLMWLTFPWLDCR